MNSLYFFSFPLFFQIIIIFLLLLLLLLLQVIVILLQVCFANCAAYAEFCADTRKLFLKEVIFKLPGLYVCEP